MVYEWLWLVLGELVRLELVNRRYPGPVFFRGRAYGRKSKDRVRVLQLWGLLNKATGATCPGLMSFEKVIGWLSAGGSTDLTA